MSQLHKRLEHLVNYSSQLIFVSSDSISDQQRTLSEFLSLQHESTEVSFFSAESEQDASHYRRLICRQLANHTVGSFVRPLKELLQDLDPNKGHYLVCISQAQWLNATFLNELWDWVTSCRQHQEALHINIILFADQAWTEQAQTWLPSHHINKPVLLSSQSVDAVGFDVSALENLMAQKRAFFARDDTHNIIRKKWFILSVLSVFFAIFVALIAVQYPQQVRYFIETGEMPPSPIEHKTEASTNQTPLDEQVNVDNDTTNVNDQAAYEPQLELVESSTTDNLFVSNWPNDINNKTEDENDEIDNQVGQSVQTERLAPAISDSVSAPKTFRGQDNSQDFPVADIISVQQLDQQLQDAISNETLSPAPDVRDTTNQRRYFFDEAVLLDLSRDQVLLQLSGIQNRSVLTAYLRDNNLSEITWVYQTQRYGGPWFVVLYNRTFDSIAEATEALEQLPLAVQQSSPFAKRVAQVQQEILQL